MQKPKTGKFSIFSPLDAKLGSLASRVGLTQFPVGSSRVGLKIWATRLGSGWKCEQPDPISVRVQNVNPKPDSTVSLEHSADRADWWQCQTHCTEIRSCHSDKRWIVDWESQEASEHDIHSESSIYQSYQAQTSHRWNEDVFYAYDWSAVW